MRSSYSKHYRPILTALVETLTFRSNNELHQPLIFALNLIKKYVDTAMIQGVLHHCTDMTIEKNYVDSHGQSEVAIAVP